MGKASKIKTHRRIFKATMQTKTPWQDINTGAILAGWIHRDNMPEGQNCMLCNQHAAVAKVERYEQRNASRSSDIRLAIALFEETYQEQQEKGPICHETTLICEHCFIGNCEQNWFTPEVTPMVLAKIKTYGKRIRFATYRRRTKPSGAVTLVFNDDVEPDVMDVWKRRSQIERQQLPPDHSAIWLH